ncbi:undecaprenyl-diphosphate phosphatase [Atopobacter sp. AH10]|uniref:undecaprenyl-diphosphate phosphatase n=1 Tax=Atopobacter sp. AH10 TaxID=2315861 RepID=UPI000EF1B5C5|nr:undecaprenyl-diphosphate phosphatase [Atopobacter sp. AH10]RLK64104.1 undecaprenyl-diphosphate phosphatase [Atopobacter sp. AH10]
MTLIEWLKIVLIGIVEGITEWLPISSTGHMILVNEWVKLALRPEFTEMFLVVIQLAAILAVVLVFFKKLNPFDKEKDQAAARETWLTWGKIIVGCLPAGVFGLLLDDWMDAHLYNAFVVAITLILYGVFFILIENRSIGKKALFNHLGELSFKTAFLIGCFQTLALVPGTSRSGATILGAMLLGCSRYIATEYSFFLSVPIMFGASFLKLVKFGFNFTGLEIAILLFGSLIAFIVSLVAVKFLLSYIKNNDFKPFGYYRIVLGVIVLFSMIF